MLGGLAGFPVTGFAYVGSDPPKLESVMWDQISQNWGQVCGTQHSRGEEFRSGP
jgi:hypothetical protein